MATGFFHHVGSFALLLSFVLILITCISAPVVHNVAILRMSNYQTSQGGLTTINFGSFGYCTQTPRNLTCTPRQIGYSPLDVAKALDNATYTAAVVTSTKALTRVMILHPLAAAILFVAFLLGLGAGVCGSLLASLTALIAFVVTCIAMVSDFVLFNAVKNLINSDNSVSVAQYSTGAWTILIAAMAALVGTVLMFLTCCSSRMHRDRAPPPQPMGGYPGGGYQQF